MATGDASVVAVALPGASGTVGPVQSGTQNVEVAYYGFTARETAGATATFRLRDSGAITGMILDTVQLAANQSRSDFNPLGIRCAGGLYYEKVAGTVEGSVRFA